jgi:acyl transferase domain-containing protein/NADP-dependent 3-hydroxy acid dehydrogenase YdfG/acyl carrier protein/ubiquinone/menaquinone biosynthesis C-methylase UbiE
MKIEKRIQFKTVIEYDNMIVRDHQVHDVRILPGVTFLDLIYRLLRHKGLGDNQAVIEEILYLKPVAVFKDWDAQLRIVIEPEKDHYSVRAHSQLVRDGKSKTEEWQENMNASLRFEDSAAADIISIEDLKSKAERVVDLENAYQNARSAGIRHYDFMKCSGQLFLAEHYLCSEINLGDLAAQYVDDFLLHPAHLDCSTLSSIYPETRAFIPIRIKAFRAFAPLRRKCFVLVNTRERHNVSNDMLVVSLDVRDAEGRLLARFDRLSAKHVRSRELITSLEELGRRKPVSKSPFGQISDAVSLLSDSPSITAPTVQNESSVLSSDRIKTDLVRIVSEMANIPEKEVDSEKGFYDLGLESTDLMQMVRRIESIIQETLYPTLLFEYTNIDNLTKFISENYASKWKASLPKTQIQSEKKPVEESALIYARSVWKRSPGHTGSVPNDHSRLVFLFCCEDKDYSIEQWRQASNGKCRLVYVAPGFECNHKDENYWEAEFSNEAHIEAILQEAASAELIELVFMARSLNALKGRHAVKTSLNDNFLPFFKVIKGVFNKMGSRKARILFTHDSNDSFTRALHSATTGLIKSAWLENPRLVAKNVDLNHFQANESPEAFIDLILNELNLAFPEPEEVRYMDGIRSVRVLKEWIPGEILPDQVLGRYFRDNGVYLITGGTGGLGKVFARELVRLKEGRIQLALVGRSEENEAIKAFVEELEDSGARILYLSTDVSQQQECRKMVDTIHSRLGSINGILHCAGIIKDSLIPGKIDAHIIEVAHPKIAAPVHLDAVLANHPLDIFVLFSSLSAVKGNPGQADYASANAFMDAFSWWRETERKAGRRSGRTLSINWPFWEEGGMQVDSQSIAAFKGSVGMLPMKTVNGLHAFAAAVESGYPQMAMVEGQLPKIREWLGLYDGQGLDDFFNNSAEKRLTSLNIMDVEDANDIAIIGLSGRYPKAEDINQFWKNLKDGVDCITEIPPKRWQVQYDLDRTKEDAIYTKWGGFVEGIDEFDPLFFGITPRDAELMEPQARMFLQVAWHAFENAGYTRSNLEGRKVGIFSAAMWNQYQLLGLEETYRGKLSPVNSFAASIANSVSFFYDLKGPSLTLDTMCSSALTALHLACLSINAGECEMALLGAVNTSLHPAKYAFLSKGHFASSDGRCRSFGDGGDGYVPAEGVGAVLLKPLSKARDDKDFIYGVIKATSISHAGKTGGVTVPSPVAQADVIRDCYARGNIDPATISYIEAHGTGTSLGDPIEIQGLTSAFGKKHRGLQTCAIGSVKSNIGHAESCAGIAGLTKILLQMRYGTLVPSLHAEVLNPHIQFDKTPFYVQTELGEWARPIFERNNADVEVPRRAALSSFGAAGSNAHVVVDEYENMSENKDLASNVSHLFVFSALNEESLKAYAQKIIDFIELWERGDDLSRGSDLSHIAFTLQRGREAFEERLAIIAENAQQLRERLGAYLNGTGKEEGVYAGNIRKPTLDAEFLQDGDDTDVFIKDIIKRRNLGKLAYLWINGVTIAWDLLYEGKHPRRIPMPGYVFAKERYWVASDAPMSLEFKGGSAQLHPMLHRNTSTLREQRFSSVFSGAEPFIRDHLFEGKALMPGAAYLEMAQVAGTLSGETFIGTIRDISWEQPLFICDGSVEIHIRITPVRDEIEFIAFTGTGDITNIHSRGRLSLESVEFGEYPVASIKASCKTVYNQNRFYEKYPQGPLVYGTAMKVVREIRHSYDQAVARVELPVTASSETYTLYPSLLDGVFQTVLPLLGDQPKVYLPMYVKQLAIRDSLPEAFYSVATLKHSSYDESLLAFDIKVTDERGTILAQIEELTLRQVSRNQNQTACLFFRQNWKLQVVESAPSAIGDSSESFLFFVPETFSLDAVQAICGDVNSRYLVKTGSTFHLDSNGTIRLKPDNVEDWQALFAHVKNPQQAVINLVCISGESELEFNDGKLYPVHRFLALAQAYLKGANQAKLNIVVINRRNDSVEHVLNQAIVAFLKTLEKENPLFQWKVVEMDSGVELDSAQAIKLIRDELGDKTSFSPEVRYRENQREVAELLEVTGWDWERIEGSFRKAGVYVVTGGLGGLGQIFARQLLTHYQVKLVLTGRSPLTEERQELLDELKLCGGEVAYIQADTTKLEETEALLATCSERFGTLNGVIHLAGVIRDSFLIKKSRSEFDAVLAPKIQAVLNLHEVLNHYTIDLFVLFSSISSIGGNAGQSDYAYANRFIGDFAAWREQQRLSGHCSGKTLAIDWPMMETSGGMQLDPVTQEKITRETGMLPMPWETAFQVCQVLLSSSDSRIISAYGNAARIRKWLLAKPKKALKKITEQKVIHHTIAPEQLEARLKDYLKGLVHKESRIPMEKIELDRELEVYGINSVMILGINRELEKMFGELSKTLLFEYQTLGELVDYFIQNHSDSLYSVFGESEPVVVAEEDDVEDIEVKDLRHLDSSLPAFNTSRFWDIGKTTESASANDLNAPLDIAIVGMAGRYPGAVDLEQFWENLLMGRDCISEVPQDRWNHQPYFNPDKNNKGTIYSNWGGFIEDPDKFDARFFGIAPREAKLMDPQDRLFLETAYTAVEDAGYSRQALAGKKIGVFVGVMYAHYQMRDSSGVNRELRPNSTFASIANHVSYFFDFHGPSMAIDTMCSSSLTAVKLACDALQKGEITAAITGGVNLSLHPQKYLELAQNNFLASDGRCRAFGRGGDGYVPGEGVGAVLLKPLSQAESDGDHIYGVIRGCQLNHGGKTNGYTVPNPKAQSALIEATLKQAGVHPEEVSYIEAHGTGTSLGDPIEITGLTQAFGKQTEKTGFCALGSVKSNIGHLEAASGIAGISKLLLQLKHETLVPSIHTEELNPNINFSKTPFRVQTQTDTWTDSSADSDCLRSKKRIAGISSFGAGGANAHLILESHIQCLKTAKNGLNEQLIVLSAKHSESLTVYVEKLLRFVQSKDSQPPRHMSVEDVAYTLQVGRDTLEYRVAFLVQNLEELKTLLEAYLISDTRNPRIFIADNSESGVPVSDADIVALLKRGAWESIAEAWVRGIDIPWSELYRDRQPRRLSLPTYPFNRKRYWVPLTATAVEEAPAAGGANTEFAPLAIACQELPVPFLFTPHWKEIAVEQPSERSEKMQRTVLLLSRGGCPEIATRLAHRHPGSAFIQVTMSNQTNFTKPSQIDIDVTDPASFEQLIAHFDDVDRIYMIADSGDKDITQYTSDELHERESFSIFALFRMVKALLSSYAPGKMPQLYIGVINVHSVLQSFGNSTENASLVGFAKSLAREYGSLAVRCVDLELSDVDTGEGVAWLEQQLDWFLAEAPISNGVEIAYRDGKRYQKHFYPISLPITDECPYREKGVYVILGGGGGIGVEFSRYLSKHYQARIVWIGRSQADADKEKLMASIRSLGGELLYVQADACDLEGMMRAREQIISRYGTVYGVVHSAIVLQDSALANMDEDGFRRAYNPKANGSLILYNVFGQDPLDFVLFFSSAQSLSGNAGQSNYVAGSAFMDAFALHWAQMRTDTKVRLIHWGFWGSVGAVATPEYKHRLARKGIQPIETEEGIEAISRILTATPKQVAAVKVDEQVWEQLGVESGLSWRKATHGIASHFDSVQQVIVEGANVSTTEAGFENAISELETVAVDWTFEVLNQLGWTDIHNQTLNLEQIADSLSIIQDYRPLLSALLDELAAKKLVSKDSTGSWNLGMHVPKNPISTERLEAIVQRSPEIEPFLKLLEACMQEYPSILRGQKQATEVLFPQNGVSLFNKMYEGNVISDYYNVTLADALSAYLKAIQVSDKAPQTIRILEIGAGTGGTSATVLKKIAPFASLLQYVYTDISQAFLIHGRKTFKSNYPFLDFKILDIESDPKSQGFAQGSFDFVIATNVLHATRDIANTLNHVRWLIAENGCLLLNELTRKQMFITLIFGLLEGWWLATDKQRRLSGSPLLSVPQWIGILRACRFNKVEPALQGKAHQNPPQNVFLAECDGYALVESNKSADRKPEVLTQPSVSTNFPLAKSAAPSTNSSGSSVAKVEEYLAQTVLRVLEIEDDAKASEYLDQPFAELGVDSILALDIINAINKELSIDLRSTDLFSYPNIRALAAHILEQDNLDPAQFDDGDSPSQSPEQVVIEMASDFKDESMIALLQDLKEGKRDLKQVEELLS